MSKDELFNKNINLAYDMAYKLYKTTGEFIEFEDLQQMCLISLWKAINSYKNNGNCKLSTFAVNWIKKDIYKNYKKEQKHKSKLMYLENNLKDTIDLSLIDILEDENISLLDLENKISLQQYVRCFNYKDKKQKILLSYIDGLSKQDIAKENNLTIRRINQILQDFISDVKGEIKC